MMVLSSAGDEALEEVSPAEEASPPTEARLEKLKRCKDKAPYKNMLPLQREARTEPKTRQNRAEKSSLAPTNTDTIEGVDYNNCSDSISSSKETLNAPKSHYKFPIDRFVPLLVRLMPMVPPLLLVMFF